MKAKDNAQPTEWRAIKKLYKKLKRLKKKKRSLRELVLSIDAENMMLRGGDRVDKPINNFK